MFAFASSSFLFPNRSSSVYPGLLHMYIPNPFSNYSDLEQYYTFINIINFTLIQCSIYSTEPGNTFARITLTTHACTKVLQISVRPNMCYIFFFSKCRRFKDIKSNRTLPCVMRISSYLHFSSFLLISLHFSAFLCISLSCETQLQVSIS